MNSALTIVIATALGLLHYVATTSLPYQLSSLMAAWAGVISKRLHGLATDPLRLPSTLNRASISLILVGPGNSHIRRAVHPGGLDEIR